jgi:coenzyme Q-binding protein COQ10
MASAERVEVMNASCEQIFKVLTDYETYPEFMEGVTCVEVVNRDGANIKAKYDLNLIKKFTYTIDLVEESPSRVSWSFDAGDFFKKNNGSWDLKDLGDGTTEVTYKLDIDFKIMVPGMISKKLVKTSLPSMMKAVETRAQKV